MSEIAKPSNYEKGMNLLLLLIFAAAGFVPHFIFAWDEPYIPREFLLISAAMTLLTLAAIFESAEILIGRGRGIYAAAIFCTLPAVAVTACDPSFLSVISFGFIIAVGQWMAVQAKNENRRTYLLLLAVLFVGVGYLFSGFIGGILLLALIFQATANSSSKKKSLYLAGILIACYLWGTILHFFTQVGAPEFRIGFAEELSWQKQFLFSMPWLLWLIPGLLKFRREAFAILLLIIVGLWKTPLIALIAVSAPLLTLLTADYISDYFHRSEKGESAKLYGLPLGLTLAALLGFNLFVFLERECYPFYIWQMFTATAIAVIFSITVIKKISRTAFALLLVSGLIFGSLSFLANPSPYDGTESKIAEPFSFWPIIILAAVALLVYLIFQKLYGKGITTKKLKTFSSEAEFGAENFRLFSDTNVTEWEGRKVQISSAENYSFIIFGDISGSEFPFSSRRGAYFVFRSLAQVLKNSKIGFAISLGDLSTRAAMLAFRRVRTLLRHITVPLTAIPGNHDVFDGRDYKPEFFKSLFGADSASFILGSVKFILLNDARGHIKPEQFAWLEKTLSDNPTKFTLLFCHKPPFDFRTDKFYALEIREDAEKLHELLVKYKTTAVFSGHIHSLLSENKDGVTYIISGGGGSKLVTENDKHHYLYLSVKQGEILIRAKPIEKIPTDEVLMEWKFS